VLFAGKTSVLQVKQVKSMPERFVCTFMQKGAI